MGFRDIISLNPRHRVQTFPVFFLVVFPFYREGEGGLSH